MNEYEKQAQEFLSATNTEFKAEFLRFGKHFEDDKENRDIYTITLKRGNREFIFHFGNSINDSGFYFTMGVQRVDLDKSLLSMEDGQLSRHIKNKISFGFLNNKKSDVIHRPKTPTAYSVLACLTKYDPGTFEDFCSEFGYDEDSRKAEKIYKAVVDEYKNVAMLFNDEEIEQLAEIQ